MLLRQAWREGTRIRKKIIANLSKLPPEVIEGFRTVPKGGIAVDVVSKLLDIERSVDHGNVVVVLGTARRMGLERLRQLTLAAIVARVLAPDSKLATARRLLPEIATSSLGALLELGPVTDNELFGMLDWLLKRQPWIERSLAWRHLRDASSLRRVEFLPRGPALAAFGHNRDGKKQIVFGLLCSSEGCPIAVDLFAGAD